MAEAKLAGILRSVSGSLGNFVFRTTRNGVILANPPLRRTGPPTAEQRTVQSLFSAASKAWKNLSDAQREAWGQYAAAYFPEPTDDDGDGHSGQAIFLKAYWYQSAAGATLPTNAPTVAPPVGPTAILLTNSPLETTMTVRVRHTTTPITGHRMLFEITPLSARRVAPPPATSGPTRA